MPDTACPTCGAPVPGAALFCPQCGARTGFGDSQVKPDEGSEVPSRLARALGPKYEVRRMLGEGGFAQVFEVWDTDLQRRLAVKVLRPDIAWSAGMLDRFRSECRAIARLSHPNILTIHFVGEGEGLTYYAMPFVDGEPLSLLLRRQGALSLDRALAIIRPILEALSHAHGQGLIHRDIKPDNIMLEASSNRPLLVDFGIAKQLDGSGHRTQTGFVVGTPQYMSPEQALGQGDVDARSDLYAVGAMMYQMVTGAPPFEGDTSQEIVGKHLSEPAPVATAQNARIPMWLSEVIVRCLAKRPAERYQSAAMLLDALSSGRMSGASESVSAERVARRLKTDAATQLLSSAERSSAGASSSARTVVTGARAAEPKKRTGMLLGVVLVAAAAAAWFGLRGGPMLEVENALVEPIRIVVEGRTVEVAPGGKATEEVRRQGPLVVQWYLVRPMGPGNQPLGVELQGSFTEPKPGGRMTYTVDARDADPAVFAPLISNATTEQLGVTVNAGLVSAQSCNCRVNPGAVRVRIGYYPLYQNSTVQASTPAGRIATFRDLGKSVDLIDGTVGLRFEAKDF